MRLTRISLLAPLAATALLLGACSGGGDRAVDASEDGAAGQSDGTIEPAPIERPDGLPAAPGEVTTGVPVTVIDQGEGTQVCLGSITMIFPPNCGGPAVSGWDWESAENVMQEGEVRWGTYVLTGTWDGESLAVTDASTEIAGPPSEPVEPFDGERLPPAELDRIAAEVGELPLGDGAALVDRELGVVVLEIVYDDGSVQAWADATYGAGAVRVQSQLSDV